MQAKSRVVPEILPIEPINSRARGPTVLEIINGARCSPLTISEFEAFLKYSEHSVENLQFTVWFRSYVERFSALPTEVQDLSPAPQDRYRPHGTSTRTSSMRTTSIMEKDRTWWDRLTSSRATVQPEEKGSDDWDADQGFIVEMEPAAAQRGSPLVELLDSPTAKAKAAGFAAERNIAPLPSPGESIDFNEAIHPIAQGPHINVSPFPSRPSSLVKTGSPVLGGTGTPPPSSDTPVQRSSTPLQKSFKPPLVRMDSSTSVVSDAESDTLDRKANRFPNLRFANLAPLTTRTSREKKLPDGTPLPFLDEVSLILTTFILPGSSRELNIDARLRKHILKSLRPTDANGNLLPPRTTHPEIFREVADATFDMMENSLPKYLVYAKGNTNAPKTVFWWTIGAIDFLIGVMIALVIMYRVRSRWWRIFSFLFIQFGTMQMYSASRYFCSQVHGRTSRQLYPWELTGMIDGDSSDPSLSASAFSPPVKSGALAPLKSSLGASLPFLFDEKSTSVDSKTQPKGPTLKMVQKPWYGTWRNNDGSRVAVFGPERVVEDEYIKDLHNKQIKEILIVGVVVTILLEVMFVALPEQVR